MSGLNGRVRVLERQQRRDSGCPQCHGQGFTVYDPATDDLSWLDEFSCCRACGAGVKVIYRDLWDKLA